MNNICVVDKITLNIPEVDLQPAVNELCSSPETVEKLEQCVMNWQTNITVVLEEQQHKKPQVGGSATLRGSERMCWPRFTGRWNPHSYCW